MRIVIVSDAWFPQVNGVVTTLRQTRDELVALGHDVLMVTPEGRRSIPLPSYPEIRLALFQGRRIAREIDAYDPDCIHIATEGPLGYSARRYCLRRGRPFTTAYHTQFPEYVRSRIPVPIRWTAALIRWFHRPAVRTMTPTRSIKTLLELRGHVNVVIWSRGVDTDLFSPSEKHDYDLPRPIWIYAGRVAVEKNIEQFLRLDLAGSKVIIGDGPDRPRLSREFPGCHFVGYRFGRELAAHMAGGDVFVFPSKTDTFGLVMLEAMACGLPVAALPVTGPIDVVRHGETGILNNDLANACRQALLIDRRVPRAYAEDASWSQSTRQFASLLAPRLQAGQPAVSPST